MIRHPIKLKGLQFLCMKRYNLCNIKVLKTQYSSSSTINLASIFETAS